MSIQALSSTSVRGFRVPGLRVGAAASRRATSANRSADAATGTVQPAGDTLEPADGSGKPADGRNASGNPVDTLELSPQARMLGQLSDAEQRAVMQLRARDQEVRTHEQAHLAAAGPFATGGPQFETATGPDGQQYAVGGEVGIDTSPVKGDPEATVRKAQVIRAAALAPASPSSQDFSVASQASEMEMDALTDLRRKEEAQREEATGAQATPESPIKDDAPQEAAATPLDVYA